MTETVIIRKANNNGSLEITINKTVAKRHKLKEGDLVEITLKKLRR